MMTNRTAEALQAAARVVPQPIVKISEDQFADAAGLKLSEPR
jgi:hypothetical protein